MLHPTLVLLYATAVAAMAPLADGSGGWHTAFQRAKSEVAKLTLEEKLNVTIFGNSLPSINFPGVRATDGPSGLNGALGHSAFTAPLTAASTFDRKLIYERAAAMGEEAFDSGYLTFQGVMVNVARTPEGGRNFEGFGADPYLSSEFAAQSVKGIQSTGVAATVKHFILNDQERQRSTSSSNVDDTTLREIYLPAFEEAVKSGVVSVLCSYNMINGTFACENEATIGTILKGELGFNGWVVTDLASVQNSLKTFLAGADADSGGLSSTIPNEYNYMMTGFPALGSSLLPLVQNGSVPISRVDDAVIRTLSAYYHLKLDQIRHPSVTTSSEIRNVQRNHKENIREVSAAGTVLLKNVGEALPFRKPAALAVFGLDATTDPHGLNIVESLPPYGYAPGLPPTSRGNTSRGTVSGGYGSAFSALPYLITPLDALTQRAREEGTVIQSITDNYDITNIDVLASQTTNSACLVFINSDSGESIAEIDGNYGDRNNLTSWYRGDALVEQVAAQCLNTIVITHSPSALLMPWAEHENITAIVWAGLPGQEAGNSLVDILYGDVNPSGRLPYTIAKRYEDYSAHVDFSIPLVYNGTWSQIDYKEGLLTDYRHFQANKIKPLYAFGYGLSYTSFKYSALKIKFSPRRRATTDCSTAPDTGRSTPYPSSLYQEEFTITVKVKNEGKYDGHEVSQLCLEFPSIGRSFRALKGFERTFVKKGETKVVKFVLRKRDISYWSAEKHGWVAAKEIKAFVGGNSEDLELKTTFSP